MYIFYSKKNSKSKTLKNKLNRKLILKDFFNKQWTEKKLLTIV